jgi:hypothetical protein
VCSFNGAILLYSINFIKHKLHFTPIWDRNLGEIPSYVIGDEIRIPTEYLNGLLESASKEIANINALT